MTRLQRDPPSPGICVAGIVQADDHVEMVYRTGEATPLVPSGHARPSGWSTEPTATRRRP